MQAPLTARCNLQRATLHPVTSDGVQQPQHGGCCGGGGASISRVRRHARRLQTGGDASGRCKGPPLAPTRRDTMGMPQFRLPHVTCTHIRPLPPVLTPKCGEQPPPHICPSCRSSPVVARRMYQPEPTPHIPHRRGSHTSLTSKGRSYSFVNYTIYSLSTINRR
eukprot:358695-Chlamydomonas_euryale.AAC.8